MRMDVAMGHRSTDDDCAEDALDPPCDREDFRLPMVSSAMPVRGTLPLPGRSGYHTTPARSRAPPRAVGEGETSEVARGTRVLAAVDPDAPGDRGDRLGHVGARRRDPAPAGRRVDLLGLPLRRRQAPRPRGGEAAVRRLPVRALTG